MGIGTSWFGFFLNDDRPYHNEFRAGNEPRRLYAVNPRASTEDKRLAKAAGSGRVSPSKMRA